MQLPREEVPQPAVARLGDPVACRDENRGSVQGNHVTGADADVPGIWECGLHRRDGHAEGWAERGDPLVQCGSVALRAGDERAARIRAPIGADGSHRDSEPESLGLERHRQAGGARPVVGEQIGARGARGRGRRRQDRVGDSITTGACIFSPIRIEIERQRQ